MAFAMTELWRDYRVTARGACGIPVLDIQSFWKIPSGSYAVFALSITNRRQARISPLNSDTDKLDCNSTLIWGVNSTKRSVLPSGSGDRISAL